MEAETERAPDHDARRNALASDLSSTPDLRLRDRPAASTTHPSAAGRLAPSESARLVGDEVAGILEAANVAAAQIRTKAHRAVTEAQQKLIEARRALDELSDQLNELTVGPGATRTSPPSTPKTPS